MAKCTVAFAALDNAEQAIECLSQLRCEPAPQVAAELRRVLGEPDEWLRYPHRSYALARWAGSEVQRQLAALLRERRVDAPYLLQELELFSLLSDQSVLALGGSRWATIFWAGQEEADPAQALAEDAAYLDFSREILQQAVRRLEAIHAGTQPYVADGAFSLHDTPVIARAVRVAALRDESWLPELLARMLPWSCVAPGTAKTAPSQSLAIALGHAIEGAPTPEGVQALRQALTVVRHAGIQKKLARNLKPAERALLARPAVALRLTGLLKAGKREQGMVASSLEAGFWLRTELDVAAWRNLLQSPAGGPVARALVWRATWDGAGVSVMADAADAVTDGAGAALRLPETARLTLWHPLHVVAAERAAWQALAARQRWHQPLRQIYREFYLAPDDFAGHVLAVRQLLGLARREGWKIEHHAGLARQFGAVRVLFNLSDSIYPGADGYVETRGMQMQLRDGKRWRVCAPDQIDPVVYSEACRAVDLLVSVAGLALQEENAGLPEHLRARHLAHLASLRAGPRVLMRQRALAQALAPLIATGQVIVTERTVQVAGCGISLATGRVTRDGAPVALATQAGGKLAAVPWLPYDEVLLERIAGAVNALLQA
ncbi:DUF4132 domain-containing protein [Duganella sp. FT80W]|uniref:DUF4132 domain-containing protein n=1 Tax=Duganella guangzhouensis TaxID=2666084 RepID=A0A6I2L8W3_9BURK|nr:DUF4132 domain-containing protein [Duganella guangzhouensis]